MSKQVNIDVMRGQQDTARAYKWDVRILGAIDDTPIVLRCTSADQPQPTNAIGEVLIRAFTKKEAGGIDWNDITFQALETVSYAITKALWGQSVKQFDPRTGVQSTKAASELTVELMLLDNSDRIAAKWTCYGCLLTTSGFPQMSSDKSGFVDISFTLGYDFALLS